MTFDRDTDKDRTLSWSHQEVARYLDHDRALYSAARRIVNGPVTDTAMAHALLRLVMAHDIPGVDYTLVDFRRLVADLRPAPAPMFEVVGSFVFEEDTGCIVDDTNDLWDCDCRDCRSLQRDAEVGS